jgi:hypothetical protein
MRQPPVWLPELYSFFDQPKVRWAFVGISFFFHLIVYGGIVIGERFTGIAFVLEENHRLSGLLVLPALSLFPIIFFSRTLKKMFVNLAIACAPAPCSITILMIVAEFVSRRRGDVLEGAWYERWGTYMAIFIGLYFMTLMISLIWNGLAFVLRFLCLWWMNKTGVEPKWHTPG